MLPWDATIDGQVYANWMPRISEYELDATSRDMSVNASGQSTYPGRAYGFELIARRRLGHRLFGWIAYTLARAERDYPLSGWRPADFDQTQIINAVASYALGRSWTISGVFHYNSGRPFSPGQVVGGRDADPRRRTATSIACPTSGASTSASTSARRSTPGISTSTSTG